jgi:hypothetical protein
MDPSTLLPDRVRTILYVVSVMLAAGYAVVDPEGVPMWVRVAYAAWNAGIGVLAVANVSNKSDQGEN